MENEHINEEIKENTQTNQEEELITDFSNMFKGPGFGKRPTKLASKKIESTPNWLLQIPAKLQITKKQMYQRKLLNQKRWNSIVKCQNKQDQLLCLVLSAWNYLFSTKGLGTLPSINLKKGKQILIETSKIYFTQICKSQQVKGAAQVLYKPSNPNKKQQTVDRFIQGLKKQQTAYGFLAFDTCWCPVGFDNNPLVPIQAFKILSQIKKQNLQLWIISCPTNRNQQTFFSKRWSDIKNHLQTVWPNYTNINQPKSTPKLRPDVNEQNQHLQLGSSNCILQFYRL